jgi:hypothetical protein
MAQAASKVQAKLSDEYGHCRRAGQKRSRPSFALLDSRDINPSAGLLLAS